MPKKLIYISLALVLLQTLYAQSITWQRTYGAFLGIEFGHSIVQTPDSGYIAGGQKRLTPPYQMYFLRLNKFGDVIWERIIDNDVVLKIERTSDNNYILMGLRTIIKININGDNLWMQRRNDNNKIYNAIKQTSDGGFIICGYNRMNPGYYPYIFKISPNGDSLWERTYSNGIFEGAWDDLVIEGSNFIAAGNMRDSIANPTKLIISKFDSTGNIIWFHRHDTLRNYDVNSLVKTTDGGYMIGGGNNSAALTKYNSNGNFQWLKRYEQSLNVGINSITNALDGNYTYIGYWDSTGNADFYLRLRKVDIDGNEIWRKAYSFTLALCIRSTNDSGYISIGHTDYNNKHFEDFYVIKYDKNGYASPYIGIEPISTIVPNDYELSNAYPNPFNPITTIRFDVVNGRDRSLLVVYDMLGREVTTLVNENLTPGSYEVKWDASNYPSGVYFAVMSAGEFKATKKLILIK